MTDSTRTTRATVVIGSLTIDGFMLPDGSYRMSLTQAAECIGLTTRNASDFLQSKAFKALMGEGYTVPISEAAARASLHSQSCRRDRAGTSGDGSVLI